MPFLQCKLCLQEKELIDSHVLPKWCFRHGVKDLSQPSIILTTDPKQRATRHSPGSIGVYDQNILCKNCDEYFSPWERYFKEGFFEKMASFPSSTESPLEKPIIWAQNFSQEQVRLFLLSLLWRASISKNPFYRMVNCGEKYEEKIKTLLLTKDASTPNDFPIWAKYYFDKDQKSYSTLKFSPFRHEMDGVNCYTFVFLACEFTIKIDARKTPSYMEDMNLGVTSFWPIFPKAFIGSEIQEMAIEAQRRVNTDEKKV